MTELFYNLKTDLSGGNVCDKSYAFRIESG